jgi:hypothetical protein
MRVAAPPRHRRAAAPTIAQVRGRARLVSSLWWLAAAVGFVVYAYSRPGPAPGCQGDGCWSQQGLLLLLGFVLGLPVTLIGMTICAVVIGFRARSARSGALLGSWVAWVGIGLVVALSRTLTIG